MQKDKKKTNILIKMPVEDEKSFKSSHKWWIYNKLFVAWDNKVKDHDHLTGKYTGSAHWSFNIIFELT